MGRTHSLPRRWARQPLEAHRLAVQPGEAADPPARALSLEWPRRPPPRRRRRPPSALRGTQRRIPPCGSPAACPVGRRRWGRGRGLPRRRQSLRREGDASLPRRDVAVLHCASVALAHCIVWEHTFPAVHRGSACPGCRNTAPRTLGRSETKSCHVGQTEYQEEGPHPARATRFSRLSRPERARKRI